MPAHRQHAQRDPDALRRRGRALVRSIQLLGLVLVVGAWWVGAGRPLPHDGASFQPAVLASAERGSAAPTPAINDGRPLLNGLPVPLPPADARPERLLPKVEPGPGGPHTFMHVTSDGTPILLDPCRPLHYVVRTAGMPQGALDAIRAAVTTIGNATGIFILEDGAVDEGPARERDPLQPERYPGRWSPVLFTWSSPQNDPGLSAEVAGLGGGQVISLGGPGTERIVTGTVDLNADVLEPMLTTSRGRAYVELVATHELAHVVGLDHVDDESQLMDSGPIRVSGLGAGDRQGLALAGAGPCHTDT